jgi:hypothetical protein
MRKILVVLGAIFLVFIVAIIVFALTFDINRYRGIIIEKLSEAIQKDIALGRISLDFSHGLGCRVDDVVLKEKDTAWDDAWLKARSTEISVRIMPLLRKDVQIDHIEIEGLDLKLSDELLRQPVKPGVSSQEKLDTGTAALGALKFIARAIAVRDSTVTYTPAKTGTAVKLDISTLILSNVSLYGPVRVNAVLSTPDKGMDNIIIKCIVFPEISTKSPYVKNLDLKLDLGGIDLPLILRSFGYTQAAEQLIDKKVQGIATIRAPKLFISPTKIFDSHISTGLSGFETDIFPLKGGIKTLMVDAELSGKNLTIKNCSGTVAGGDISASLFLKDLPSVIYKRIVPCLEDVKARIVLDGLDVQGIASALGNADIKKALSETRLKGVASIQAEDFYPHREKIWDSIFTIALEKFSCDSPAVPGGIKDLNLEATFSNGEINIKNLAGVIGGGTIVAQGIVKGIRDFKKDKGLPVVKDFNCQFDLGDFDVPSLLKAFGKDELASKMQGKRLKGSIVVEGDTLFLSPADIFKSEVSISVSKLDTDIIGTKGGVSDLDIQMSVGQGDLLIEKLSGIVAGGPISASGKIKNIASVVSREGTLETENVFAQFNLQDFNIAELVAMSGKEDIARTIEGKTIVGKVTVKSDKFSLGQKERISGLSILVSQGMTDMVPIQGGLDDIELEAALEENNLVVHRFTGSAAEGDFSIQGSIKDIFSSQFLNLDVSCRSMNLDKLLPQTNPGSPRFQGVADLKATVQGQYLQKDQLMESLTGSGSLKIDKPVLRNMNILRIAFEKMDMIPGLVARLRENLPENYTQLLKQNDTYFRPMNVSYTIAQGNLVFKDAIVESDGFLVKAQGGIGLLGDVDITSHLFIAPDLSLAFVDIVRELRFLEDEQGRINMPLAITGKAPQITVNIDRDYVLSKLIVSKGFEMLERVFNKEDKSQQETQPAGPQQDTDDSNLQQKEESSAEPAALIKSIFDIIESQ